MKQIWFFLLTTIKGGIFFFLPLVFIGIMLQKAVTMLSKFISPLAARMGIDDFAGKATLTILVLIIIVIMCFLGGLLIRIRFLKRLNEKLEELLLKFLPDYRKIKAKKDQQELQQ